MAIKKAIIPAAGLGTRFLPATKAMPKEMLPIVDVPALQYIVEEAVASGIEEILIITGRNKSSIEDHFDRNIELENELLLKGKSKMLDIVKSISELADIHYIRQKHALGLGHAILRAKAFIGDEPFAVLLGDDVIYSEAEPAIAQLMKVYDNTGAQVIGVGQIDIADSFRYGMIYGDKLSERLYEVKGLVEKPSSDESPSNMAIFGRYILTPEIFSILEKTAPGVNGEIQLTSAIETLLDSRRILAYEFEGMRYDIGDKLGYLIANIEYALRSDELSNGLHEYLRKY